jgi:hypothetical protein
MASSPSSTSTEAAEGIDRYDTLAPAFADPHTDGQDVNNLAKDDVVEPPSALKGGEAIVGEGDS